MRIVIVDDEPLARSRLASLCARRDDLAVVAQVGCGADALQAIREHQPDLLLLDMELQDMSGFDVLQSLEGAEPLAILVTAHPEHAARAFEAAAVDYLTKPVDYVRFNSAIDRAHQRRAGASGGSLRERVAAEVRATLVNHGHAALVAPRQLVGEKARRLYFIDADTVDYVESDGNYVNIHVGEDHYIARNSVKHLARLLAPAGFLRIERSLLVNLSRVMHVERAGNGVFAFTLRSGRKLLSGATFRRPILDEIRLGQLAARGGAH